MNLKRRTIFTKEIKIKISKLPKWKPSNFVDFGRKSEKGNTMKYPSVPGGSGST